MILELVKGRRGDLGVVRHGGFVPVPQELVARWAPRAGDRWVVSGRQVLGPVSAIRWVPSHWATGWAVAEGMAPHHEMAVVGDIPTGDDRSGPAYTWALAQVGSNDSLAMFAHIVKLGGQPSVVGSLVRVVGPGFPAEVGPYRWAMEVGLHHFPVVGRRFSVGPEGLTVQTSHEVPGLGSVAARPEAFGWREAPKAKLTDEERLEIQRLLGVRPEEHPILSDVEVQEGWAVAVDRPWDIRVSYHESEGEYVSPDERGTRSYVSRWWDVSVRPPDWPYEYRGFSHTPVPGSAVAGETDRIRALEHAMRTYAFLRIEEWRGESAWAWTESQTQAWVTRCWEASVLPAMVAEAKERLTVWEALEAFRKAELEAEREAARAAEKAAQDAYWAARAAEAAEEGRIRREAEAAKEAERVASGQARREELGAVMRLAWLNFQPDGIPGGYQVADGFPLPRFPSPREALAMLDEGNPAGVEAWGQEMASWPEGLGPWGHVGDRARAARKLPRKK